MNHPLLLLALLAGAGTLAKLWRDDVRALRAGRPNPAAFPGATPPSGRAIAIGIAGAVLLVGLESYGEHRLGLVDAQSRVTVLFAVYSILGAPVIEEIIFRGWLVVEGRGRVALWSGIVAASLGFALLHPFLWAWDDAGWRLTPDAKGVFSTACAFTASLWFYVVRFAPWNPSRSLLPCFAAHAARNAAVVGVKAALGFVSGAW